MCSQYPLLHEGVSGQLSNDSLTRVPKFGLSTCKKARSSCEKYFYRPMGRIVHVGKQLGRICGLSRYLENRLLSGVLLKNGTPTKSQRPQII